MPPKCTKKPPHVHPMRVPTPIWIPFPGYLHTPHLMSAQTLNKVYVGCLFKDIHLLVHWALSWHAKFVDHVASSFVDHVTDWCFVNIDRMQIFIDFEIMYVVFCPEMLYSIILWANGHGSPIMSFSLPNTHNSVYRMRTTGKACHGMHCHVPVAMLGSAALDATVCFAHCLFPRICCVQPTICFLLWVIYMIGHSKPRPQKWTAAVFSLGCIPPTYVDPPPVLTAQVGAQ